MVLSARIDDISVTARGTKCQVVAGLTQARGELDRGLRQANLPVAADKTCVVATTQRVAEALAQSIPWSSDTNAVAKRLGADHTLQRHGRRTRGRRITAPAWKARRSKRARRALRTRILGSRHACLFVSGIVPVGLCGVEFGAHETRHLTRLDRESQRLCRKCSDLTAPGLAVVEGD